MKAEFITNGNHITGLRGTIESRQDFIHRNLTWWKENRRGESATRQPYYERFLQVFDVRDRLDGSQVVGEIGPGPFGGIIEVCNLPARFKIFIDYIMSELVGLQFIDWPKENVLFLSSGAEEIPHLSRDEIDVLLSYNCLDHGWDIERSLRECFRISKACFLGFDCRGDNEAEIRRRRGMGDKDHWEIIRFEQIEHRVSELISIFGGKAKVIDLGTKGHWPVAGIAYEK